MNFKRYFMLLSLSATTLFIQTQNELTKLILSDQATVDMIKSFLLKEIEVEHKALNAVVKSGNIQMAQILLKNYNFDIDHLNKDGNSLLMEAIQNNDWKMITVILKKSTDLKKTVNMVNPYNKTTALILAVGRPFSSINKTEDNYKIVELLIDLQADVNYDGYKPWLGRTITPYTLAVQAYNDFGQKNPSLFRIVLLLKKSGAITSSSSLDRIKEFKPTRGFNIS